MEAFTIVLLTGWILLLAAFAGMYFLDRAVKEAANRRAGKSIEK